MRAALLRGYRDTLTVESVSVPEPPTDGVLLRVLACGICRSDWHVWHGDWEWRLPLTLPHILGHEVVGEVVAIGAAAQGLAVGDRVVVPFHLNCGACSYCDAGSANLCDNYSAIGFQRPGGFAEFIAVPASERNVLAIPATVDPVIAAALGCRVMTAWHALHDRARVTASDRVVIAGSGGLGLAALLVAKSAGARVLMIDRNAGALALATRLGADAVLSLEEATPLAIAVALDGAPTLSVDAVGNASAAAAGLAALGKRGRHLQLGLSGSGEGGAFALPIDRIVKAEIDVLGSVGSPRASHLELVEAMAAGALSLAELEPRRVGLDGITDVFEAMRAGTMTGFAVVVP